ncbi:ornithine carbamoyltransferase [Brevibacillus dissolubilis]|uniref:ornithine carbamoyltransferase n=1 Tax=Brevibacillus dissolubilis TaxID=1844116 RepID=UPI001116F3C1|nr:ornithine carbamoyltransferase [Brevibacillus dissolubilis]
MLSAKTFNLYPNLNLQHFKGRDVLRIDEFNQQELHQLVQLALDIKKMQKAGTPYQPLKGKTLGMIFTKSSTRTRVSFEVGMYQLGGMSLFLSDRDLQIGRGEPISDTAQVMSRYLDCIMIRTHAHEDVEELARYADIPIINGLTDQFHPCQALADLLTILEHKGSLEGVKLTYIGDGNNVANSLVLGAALLGLDIRVATPEGYEMDPQILQQAQAYANQSGAKLLTTHDPLEAVHQTEVIYTDVWTSMGFEAENEKRLKDFAAYQVNQDLMKNADPNYLFMHCLPAHRGEEVAADVIDSKHSIVFDQAENRLHAQKAILTTVL